MTGSWAPTDTVPLAVVALSDGDFFVNGDVPPPTTWAPPPTTPAAPPAAGILETAPPLGGLFGGESPPNNGPSAVDWCQTLPGSSSNDNGGRAISSDIPCLPAAAENWQSRVAALLSPVSVVGGRSEMIVAPAANATATSGGRRSSPPSAASFLLPWWPLPPPAPSVASSLHFLQVYAPYAQIASLHFLAHP